MKSKKIIAGILSLATLATSVQMAQIGVFQTALADEIVNDTAYEDTAYSAEETYPATAYPEDTSPEYSEADTLPDSYDETEWISGRSGYCGENVYFVLRDDGTLVISGTGPMYDGYNHIDSVVNSYSVKDIIIKDGVTSIGERAFSSCSSAESIIIPDSVTSIGDGAFYDCSSLTTINIPDTVTSIGSDAFQKCDSLKSIVIPKSVRTIGSYAFNGCENLESVTFLSSNICIDKEAFDGTKWIDEKRIESSNGSYCMVVQDGILVEAGYRYADGATLPYTSDTTSCIVPDSVKTIASGAFDNFYLKDITLPISLKLICKGAFDAHGNEIKNVYYAGTEEMWNKIDIRNDNFYLRNAVITFGGEESTEIEDPTSETLPETTAVTDPTEETTQVSLGNVNDDSWGVDYSDVLAVLRYCADVIVGNKPDQINITAADVDKDGKITTKDAAFICQYLVNYNISFEDMTMESGNADYTVDVSVGNIEVTKSQYNISIPVYISGKGGISSSAIRFTASAGVLNCDEDYNFYIGNYALARKSATSIVITSAYSKNIENEYASYYLNFKLPDDAKVGDVYDITPYVEELANSIGQNVSANVTAGSVKVVDEIKPTLNIGKVYSVEGSDTINVPVKLSGDISRDKLKMIFDFDPMLTLTDVKCAYAEFNKNIVEISFSEHNYRRYEDEEICTLCFKVSSKATAGSKLPISGTIVYDGENYEAASGLISIVGKSDYEKKISYDHSKDKETVIEVANIKLDESVAGSTIDIPVRIFNNPGFCGTGILYTASVGSFSSLEDGKLEGEIAVRNNVVAVTSVGVKDHPSQIVTGDGVLYTLQYVVPDNVKTGDTIDIQAEKKLFTDNNERDVDVKIYGGKITIAGDKQEASTTAPTTTTTTTTTTSAPITPGDLNGDGKIDSKDAVIVLQKYAEELVKPGSSKEYIKLGDINGDGKLDSKDAVKILQTYANALVNGN